MKLGRIIVLAVAVGACGVAPRPLDASPDGGVDGGRDAGPPACLQPSRPGQPFPDLAACMLCLELYGVLANPYGLTPGRGTRAGAVPGGVFVLMQNAPSELVFISETGLVTPNSQPLVNPENARFSPWTQSLTVVPGTRRAWVASTFGTLEPTTDLTLMELTDDGWMILAHESFQWMIVGPVAAADGWLVGAVTPAIGAEFQLASFEADGSGGIRWLVRTFPELGMPTAMSYKIGPGWSSGAGVAAVVGTQDGSQLASYLLRIDVGLVADGPVLALGAPVGDAGYEANENPIVVSTATHIDGSTILVLIGRRRGQALAPFAEVFFQRLDTSGGLVDSRPVLVNDGMATGPDEDFGMTDAAAFMTPDGWGVRWTVWAPPGSTPRFFDVARSFQATGDATPLVTHTFPSGVLLRAGTQDRIGHLVSSVQMSGGGHDRLGAESFTASFDSAWLTWAQDCDDRTGEGGGVTTGAWEDGIWLIWADEFVEPATGQRVLVTKAALVRSDGTFAWGT